MYKTYTDKNNLFNRYGYKTYYLIPDQDMDLVKKDYFQETNEVETFDLRTVKTKNRPYLFYQNYYFEKAKGTSGTYRVGKVFDLFKFPNITTSKEITEMSRQIHLCNENKVGHNDDINFLNKTQEKVAIEIISKDPYVTAPDLVGFMRKIQKIKDNAKDGAGYYLFCFLVILDLLFITKKQYISHEYLLSSLTLSAIVIIVAWELAVKSYLLTRPKYPKGFKP